MGRQEDRRILGEEGEAHQTCLVVEGDVGREEGDGILVVVAWIVLEVEGTEIQVCPSCEVEVVYRQIH